MSKKEKEREKFNVAKQQHKKSNQTRSELYSVDPFERERERFYYNYYICKENRRINCRLAKKQQQY